MEITLEKKSAVEAQLKLQIKEADYAKQLEDKIKEYSKKAQIKGFRPGKVPTTLIKKMYGKALKAEEVNQLISKSLSEYIKRENLSILGEPLPNEEGFPSIDWESQSQFEFLFDIGLAPEFELSFQKLKPTQHLIELDKSTVEDTIKELRERFSETTYPEETAEEDFVFGDIVEVEGAFKGTGLLPLNKVSKSELNQFIGLKKDQEIVFNVKSALDKDESAIAMFTGIEKEKVAELSEMLRFTVKNITRKAPAELSQDFFNKVFGEGVVEGEENFRNKLKETVQDNFQRESDQLLEIQLKKEITDSVSIDLPDSFLQRWLIMRNEGKMTEDQVKSEYPKYLDSLKWSLIKDKIAKQELVEVVEQEVIERAKEILRSQFAQYGMLSQIEPQLDEFALNYLKRDDGANFTRIFELLHDQKVLSKLKEKVKLKEKKVSVEEFKKIAEQA